MHVVTLKLGQMSKEHVLTERHKHKTQAHFVLQMLASVARYEPFRMILVKFVTKSGV